MRSLACGRPVIGSKNSSLDFIEKLELGALIEHPLDIARLSYIIENEKQLEENCKNKYLSNLSFENYWASHKTISSS